MTGLVPSCGAASTKCIPASWNEPSAFRATRTRADGRICTWPTSMPEVDRKVAHLQRINTRQFGLAIAIGNLRQIQRRGKIAIHQRKVRLRMMPFKLAGAELRARCQVFSNKARCLLR